MGTTKLALYNGALLILKSPRLTTLADARAERRAMDDAYDEAVASLLEEADWNFAARTVSLEATTDFASSFGYNYAFEHPEDFVRLISIADNAEMYPQLRDYKDESAGVNGRVFVANCDPIYISYVSNDNAYGLDLGNWPMAFVRAVQ